LSLLEDVFNEEWLSCGRDGNLARRSALQTPAEPDLSTKEPTLSRKPSVKLSPSPSDISPERTLLEVDAPFTTMSDHAMSSTNRPSVRFVVVATIFA
jgi:hypothetical protein